MTKEFFTAATAFLDSLNEILKGLLEDVELPGRDLTDEQEHALRSRYGDLTVAELRRRGSGRGFRPATLRGERKADIINMFIDYYGWDRRLIGEGWEERYWTQFVDEITSG